MGCVLDKTENALLFLIHMHLAVQNTGGMIGSEWRYAADYMLHSVY